MIHKCYYVCIKTKPHSNDVPEKHRPYFWAPPPLAKTSDKKMARRDPNSLNMWSQGDIKICHFKILGRWRGRKNWSILRCAPAKIYFTIKKLLLLMTCALGDTHRRYTIFFVYTLPGVKKIPLSEIQTPE